MKLKLPLLLAVILCAGCAPALIGVGVCVGTAAGWIGASVTHDSRKPAPATETDAGSTEKK